MKIYTSVNFGEDTPISIDEKSFVSNTYEKAIVKINATSTNDYNDGLYSPTSDTSDYEKEIRVNPGDVIVLLNTSDSDEYELEVAAEVYITKSVRFSYENELGYSIPVGDGKYIDMCGEIFDLNKSELAILNKAFKKNYKYGFAFPV